MEMDILHALCGGPVDVYTIPFTEDVCRGDPRWKRVILRAMNNIAHQSSRTFHLIADSAAKLSVFLAQKINIDVNDALALMQLGSVYHKPSMADLHRPVRQFDDILVAHGDYVRVHPDTARYDTDSINWCNRIIFENDDFLVVDKPAGIPCCPTVGNYHENVAESVRKCLGLSKLYQPHRLDADTSGIILFGKTAAFNTICHSAMISRTLHKRYRLLLANIDIHPLPSLPPVPPMFPRVGDQLTHYMENSTSQPRILHNDNISNTKICQLRVLQRSRTITLSLDTWQHRARRWLQDHNRTHNPHGHDTMSIPGSQDNNERLGHAILSWTDVQRKYLSAGVEMDSNGENSTMSVTELEVELLTGRTHQIRAQMLQYGYGNHIAGDAIYCPPVLPGPSRLPPSLRTLHQMVGSPYLALQAASIGSIAHYDDTIEHGEEVGGKRKRPSVCPLGGRTFELKCAFWSPLFQSTYFSE